MDADSESLLELIRDAFGDVPRGSLSIHQAHIAKWADEKQLDQAGTQDHDRSWTEIPDETIEACGSAFYVDDPINWRYFVPAFLSWTLRHFRDNDSFICDQAIYAFEIYKVGDPLRQQSVLRFDTLSLLQKRCICAFLRYMAQFPGLSDADAAWRSLEAYWGQFCPGLTEY